MDSDSESHPRTWEDAEEELKCCRFGLALEERRTAQLEEQLQKANRRIDELQQIIQKGTRLAREQLALLDGAFPKPGPWGAIPGCQSGDDTYCLGNVTFTLVRDAPGPGYFRAVKRGKTAQRLLTVNEVMDWAQDKAHFEPSESKSYTNLKPCDTRQSMAHSEGLGDLYHIVLEDDGFADRMAGIPLIQRAQSDYQIFELICLRAFHEAWSDELAVHRRDWERRHAATRFVPFSPGETSGEFGAPGALGWLPASERNAESEPEQKPECPYVGVPSPHYSKITADDWDVERHPACRLARLCGFKSLEDINLRRLLALSQTDAVTGEVFQVSCCMAPFHIDKVTKIPKTTDLIEQMLQQMPNRRAQKPALFGRTAS